LINDHHGQADGVSVQRRELVVAIDGPSGSGKSTVARAVADAAGLRYLDTGAMYRAITWLALRDGVDPADAEAITALATSAALDIQADPQCPTIHADGVDVTQAVRGADVTAAVSAVSAVPDVRAVMVRRQRDVIGAGGIVVEGRDIGTTVVPDAPVKIFLTADPAIRARRRSRQDGAGTDQRVLAATQADLIRRDTADTHRATSPLTQAPDAVVLDSSRLDVANVVREVMSRIVAVERA
jgi:cytidylate kinase